MFTPADRDSLRDRIVRRATSDSRITGIAVTGSAAKSAEDRWSDIDLAFGIGALESLSAVLADLSRWMVEECDAVHSVDIHAGPWIYRAFLLPSTLQVDLALVAEDHFRALAPGFRLVHGKAKEAESFPAQSADFLIGMGWLYALHSRSAICRGKPWQSEYMISGLRDQTLALACLRHGLPSVHAKGVDQLPSELSTELMDSLLRNLSQPERIRAFKSALDAFCAEVRAAGANVAEPLERTLRSLSDDLDE